MVAAALSNGHRLATGSCGGRRFDGSAAASREQRCDRAVAMCPQSVATRWRARRRRGTRRTAAAAAARSDTQHDRSTALADRRTERSEHTTTRRRVGSSRRRGRGHKHAAPTDASVQKPTADLVRLCLNVAHCAAAALLLRSACARPLNRIHLTRLLLSSFHHLSCSDDDSSGRGEGASESGCA